ncbi:MAG: pilus assembly protein TadG-related protein [Candidatus Dormibacteria bacterium]
MRGERGQVMVIFALVSLVLFAIVGLSIDAGMSYLASDQVSRAADAAALAGVAYMPGEYGSAENAALVEAARNGFTDAGSNNTCTASQFPCVITSQPPGTTNQLKVTISVTVPSTFLKLLGFGSHVVTRSATAEYLPPIALGQPGTQQGSTLAQLGTANNFYFERTEGYGNPRSEGDPFTPAADDSANSCDPQSSCAATTAPDAQAISQTNGTEKAYPGYNLNYNGGYDYLITLAPGQSADVQVYDPAFAPDNADDANDTTYTYHEDDGSFPDDNNTTGRTDTTTDSEYSAMSYTLFSVPTLSSDMQDTLVSQDVFYPYNATCIATNGTGQYDSGGTMTDCPSGGPSYFYFNGSGHATTVKGHTPATYHQWVSVIDYTPSAADANLVSVTNQQNGVLDNTTSTTEYFRLEVDTLTWNGQATCTSNPCGSDPDTGNLSDGSSTAHKGYSVQIVPAVAGDCANTTTVTECGVSAMDDMTVYTPIINASSTSHAQFSIPLFRLDPSYAGHTIDVDIFDIGDVSNTTAGGAWVGVQQPDTGWGQFPSGVTTMTNLGTSLNEDGATYAVSANWEGTATPHSAVFQTANATGGAIYNGQWVQVQISVPSTFADAAACSGGSSNCWNDYWNLVYDVGPQTISGDTFAVEVGFAGSPDHLLP